MTFTLRGRIWRGFAATAFARMVHVGYVFVLVPVLLGAWGVELYGEWVILTALAGFGSIANLGVSQALASEIMVAVGAEDYGRASRISVTGLIIGVAFVLFMLIVTWVGFSLIDAAAFLGVSMIPPQTAVTVVILALASIVLGVLSPPLSAAISIVRGNALPTVVGALIKIGELVAIAAAAFTNGGPVWVTGMLVIFVSINILANCVLVRYLVPWLSFNPRYFDIAIMRQLIRPSFAQFMFNISTNVFAIQLPRIILGHLVGPASVAGFSVTVTYARTLRTLTTLFSQSLQVETARAFAKNRREVLIRLIGGLCQINLWSSIALLLALTLLGGPVFALWTHGRISFDPQLCMLLGTGFVVGAYADVISTFLIGINRIFAVALAHCVATLLAVGAIFFLPSEWGMMSMATALVVPEVATAVIGILTVRKLFSLRPFEFFVSTLKWPMDIIHHEIRQLMRIICHNPPQ
jgi:O-antigen/teichoic acid export membrane protein